MEYGARNLWRLWMGIMMTGQHGQRLRLVIADSQGDDPHGCQEPGVFIAFWAYICQVYWPNQVKMHSNIRPLLRETFAEISLQAFQWIIHLCRMFTWNCILDYPGIANLLHVILFNTTYSREFSPRKNNSKGVEARWPAICDSPQLIPNGSVKISSGDIQNGLCLNLAGKSEQRLVPESSPKAKK